MLSLYLNDSDEFARIGREPIWPHGALLVRALNATTRATAMRFHSIELALAYAVGANIISCMVAVWEPVTARHIWHPRIISHHETPYGHTFCLAERGVPEWVKAPVPIRRKHKEIDQ